MLSSCQGSLGSVRCWHRFDSRGHLEASRVGQYGPYAGAMGLNTPQGACVGAQAAEHIGVVLPVWRQKRDMASSRKMATASQQAATLGSAPAITGGSCAHNRADSSRVPPATYLASVVASPQSAANHLNKSTKQRRIWSSLRLVRCSKYPPMGCL